MKALYTYTETQKELTFSRDTLLRRVEEGKLDRVWLGANSPRITGESIARYLQTLPSDRPVSKSD